MKLLREIEPGAAEAVYETLRGLLRGNETVFFDAMTSATSSERQPFEAPTDPSDVETKLVEIGAKLRTADLTSNRGLMALQFLTEVLRITRENAPRMAANVVDAVSNAIHFGIPGAEAQIELTTDLNWQIAWVVTHRGLPHSQKVALRAYNADLNDIVPDYVIEYVNTAIEAYGKGRNATSAALLSIALEATLRDVLITRGYSFELGASSVDTYEYTDAEVSVDGSAYLIAFRDPNLKPASDFSVSSGGQQSVGIKMRRYVSARNGGRVDLYALTPPFLIDHWSVGDITQPANLKNIGGLGQALSVARDVEKFVVPSKLPLELDNVLKTVRNNLIHLSGDTLRTELEIQGDDTRPMTLRQFLGNANTMFTFILTMVRFINDSYVELRSAAL